MLGGCPIDNSHFYPDTCEIILQRPKRSACAFLRYSFLTASAWFPWHVVYVEVVAEECSTERLRNLYFPPKFRFRSVTLSSRPSSSQHYTAPSGRSIWRGAAVFSPGVTLSPAALSTIQRWKIAHHERECF